MACGCVSISWEKALSDQTALVAAWSKRFLFLHFLRCPRLADLRDSAWLDGLLPMLSSTGVGDRGLEAGEIKVTTNSYH